MIEKQRLHNLHAIRGWAALFVVIAHSKYPFWSGGSEYIKVYPVDTWSWYQYIVFGIDMATSFASIFVITFFVLSGFFITRSIEAKKYSIPFFYGDRVIRIYIPYIGAMLISAIALYSAHRIHPELFKMLGSHRPYNLDLIKAYSDLNIDSFFSGLLFLPGKSGLFFGMNSPSWSLYFEALFYISIPFILLYFKKISLFCNSFNIIYYFFFLRR